MKSCLPPGFRSLTRSFMTAIGSSAWLAGSSRFGMTTITYTARVPDVTCPNDRPLGSCRL